MTAIDVKALEQKVREVFKEHDHSFTHLEISVTQHNDEVAVKVSSMYEFVPLTFKTLLALSEVFGTQEFTTSQYSSSGCDTCDYGSSYEHTFTYEVK